MFGSDQTNCPVDELQDAANGVEKEVSRLSERVFRWRNTAGNGQLHVTNWRAMAQQWPHR